MELAIVPTPHRTGYRRTVGQHFEATPSSRSGRPLSLHRARSWGNPRSGGCEVGRRQIRSDVSRPPFFLRRTCMPGKMAARQPACPPPHHVDATSSPDGSLAREAEQRKGIGADDAWRGLDVSGPSCRSVALLRGAHRSPVRRS